MATAACLVPSAWVTLPALAYLLLWVPGAAIVRMLRPLRIQPGWQFSAIAASLMIMPVVLHWTWQLSNSRFGLIAVIALFDLALILMAGRWATPVASTSSLFINSKQRLLFGLLLGWIGAWVFLFYWVPVAGGRSVPSPSGDYIKHHAVLWSLERYPLPLHNVFFAAESNAPYYYYEQFYLLPATLRIVSAGGVSNEFAFGAVGALVAVTVAALIFLLARSVLDTTPAALLATVCATVVGGWDAIPTLIRFVHTGQAVLVLDAWCPVLWRVHNIMNCLVWFPQHVAALGTFLLCCYWLQLAPRQSWWLLIAPIAAASIFGSSAYMAVFCLAGAFVYVLLRWRHELRLGRPTPGRFAVAASMIGLLSAGLMASRAWHYHIMSERFGGGITLSWDRFPLAYLGRAVAPGVLANWLDAVWLVPLEFGVGALAAILVAGTFWRRLWQSDGTRLLIIGAVLGFVTLWTVRTGINSIDYAYRMGSMLTLALGAICTGALLDPARLRPFAVSWRKPLLIAGILLGLPVGLYEPPLMGLRTLVERSPVQAYAGAVRHVRSSTPPASTVQPGPTSGLKLLQLMDRQAGVMDPVDSHVNVFCPPDKAEMSRAMNDIEQAFRTDRPSAAHDLLKRWRVTHVIVGPAERERYGPVSQFSDSGLFEIVYDDGLTKVLRLRDSAE